MNSDKVIVERTEAFVAKAKPFGLYQICFMGILQTLAIYYSLTHFTLSLAILKPKFSCEDDDSSNKNISLINNTDICDVVKNCQNISMTPLHGYHSFGMEWPQLITAPCYTKSLMDPQLMLVSFARLVGGLSNIPGGFLADTVGRKPMMIIGLVVCIFGGFGAAASSTIWQFVGFFFVCIFGTQLSDLPAMSLNGEYTLSKFRLMMNFAFSWCFAYIIVGGISYATKNWRTHLLVANCICVPVIVATFFFAESPRWLIAKGKFKRAAKSLNRIAWVNGSKTRFTESELRTELSRTLDEKPVTVKRKWDQYLETGRSVILIFKNRRLAKTTAFFFYIYIVGSLFGSSFVYSLGDFFTSPYLSFTLIGVFRSWTPFFIVFLDLKFPKFKRRPFLFFGFVCVLVPLLIGTVGVLAAEFEVGNKDTAELVMTIGVLVATSMNYGLLYFAFFQITLEVYPTIVRNGAISIFAVASTIGGTMGPQVLLLQKIWRPMHFVFLDVLYIISVLGSIKYIPETKGKPLPDNFEDLELVL